MNHPDELGQAIRDKQVRYRHEAYQSRLGTRSVRRWLGSYMIQFGEALTGTIGDRQTPPPAHPSLRRPA
jgi:hypothetical protein